MSQRVNISVPDELYEKMQSFKDRLNISRICQDAVLHSVSIEEIRSQAGDDIEKLAVAFKEEREERFRKLWEEGFRDGTRDAFKLDYHWMYVMYLHQDAVPAEKFFEMAASKDTSEKIEEERLDTDLDAFYFEDVSDFYYRGYIAGLLDVWERVCKKLSIHGHKEDKEAANGDEQP